MSSKPLRVIKIQELECKRCHYRWFPKINNKTGLVLIPLRCGNKSHCNSYYWNKPYTRKKRK